MRLSHLWCKIRHKSSWFDSVIRSLTMRLGLDPSRIGRKLSSPRCFLKWFLKIVQNSMPISCYRPSVDSPSRSAAGPHGRFVEQEWDVYLALSRHQAQSPLRMWKHLLRAKGSFFPLHQARVCWCQHAQTTLHLTMDLDASSTEQSGNQNWLVSLPLDVDWNGNLPWFCLTPPISSSAWHLRLKDVPMSPAKQKTDAFSSRFSACSSSRKDPAPAAPAEKTKFHAGLRNECYTLTCCLHLGIQAWLPWSGGNLLASKTSRS